MSLQVQLHNRPALATATVGRNDVLWRLYCSGAELADVLHWSEHVSAERRRLSVAEIVDGLLEWHWLLTGVRHWYLLEPCVACGDVTCMDWGARFIGGGWVCFGCGLKRWLSGPGQEVTY